MEDKAFYFVTDDGVPFTVGGNFEWRITAWDKKEPREYSMPPFAHSMTEDAFNKARARILDGEDCFTACFN